MEAPISAPASSCEVRQRQDYQDQRRAHFFLSTLECGLWGGFPLEPVSCQVSELRQLELSPPLCCGTDNLFPLHIFIEIKLRKIPQKVTFDLGVPSGLVA